MGDVIDPLFLSEILVGLLKQPKVIIPAVVVLLIIALFTINEIIKQSEFREIENKLIPQLKKTIEESDPWNTTAAFQLAQRIEQIQPDHPELIALKSEISAIVTIETIDV